MLPATSTSVIGPRANGARSAILLCPGRLLSAVEKKLRALSTKCRSGIGTAAGASRSSRPTSGVPCFAHMASKSLPHLPRPGACSQEGDERPIAATRQGRRGMCTGLRPLI